MKTPTITTSMDRPVNLLKATTTCNAFYIFLSAAKAALLPFLTLFFRIIRLSAMETGIIMAAKTLTGFVWAPLWARCAVAYNKRRVVLMFSLLMMGVMYLSFTGVYYKVGSQQTCQPVLDHQDGNSSSSDSSSAHHNLASNGTQNPGPGAAVEQPDISHVSGSSGEENEANSSSVNEPGKGEGHNPPTHETNAPSSGGNKHTPDVPKGSHEEKGHATSTVSPSILPHKATSAAGASESESAGAQKHLPSVNADLERLKQIIEAKTKQSFKDFVQSGKLSASDLLAVANQAFPEGNFSKADVQNLIDNTKGRSADDEPVAKHSAHRVARNWNFTIFTSLKDRIGVLTATLEKNQLLLFLVVLLVIIFGEFFSSPVEKIADDAWFDFLERIDDMEKYGRQRYWGSLTFALVPIVVTCIVDYTPCKMMYNLHHFLLHFFVFGIFIVFTLFVAFYFPMPPPVKHKYSSKVGKGLRVICCDGRGLLFVVTLLVAGSVYASFHNFLFWHLQDLGSSEVTMGLCVSIGAFAETPMLVFSNKLVRKLGHGGLVSLSLCVLAARVLYYGFLWTPWAVLPAEVTNAFTHTALWYAVLSYDEFNVGSAVDRSIRSILSSVYFGLGFSMGSLVSGMVYHIYGASVLFWGASVLSGGWCLVYSLIQCCLPKKERVKYIKLLRKEEDDSSEGDDDWLEMALKDQ